MAFGSFVRRGRAARQRRGEDQTEHETSKERPMANRTARETFGVTQQPIENVVAVARKRLDCTQANLTAWAWRVLVANPDGTCVMHWFNTKRPFDRREREDHYVGAGVDLSKNCSPTTADEWEDKASDKDYTPIDDPEFWPIQCTADETVLTPEEAAAA